MNYNEKIREEFLNKFKCINPDCDSKGNIPHQVAEDEWEAEQCQFCFEYRFPIADWFLERCVSKESVREMIKERDEKMYGYYKSVFEDGFEGGYPAQWDDLLA